MTGIRPWSAPFSFSNPLTHPNNTGTFVASDLPPSDQHAACGLPLRPKKNPHGGPPFHTSTPEYTICKPRNPAHGRVAPLVCPYGPSITNEVWRSCRPSLLLPSFVITGATSDGGFTICISTSLVPSWLVSRCLSNISTRTFIHRDICTYAMAFGKSDTENRMHIPKQTPDREVPLSQTI